MTEEQKEILKEKLKNLFNEKLDSLTNKFETDINTIEELKYTYFDNVVIPFREMEEKSKKEKEKKEEPKEKDKDKDKEDKKDDKHFKKLKPLTSKENANLAKTPLRANNKREIFKDRDKDKTEQKKTTTTKIFSDKKTERNDKREKKEKKEKSELNTTLHNERLKKKNLTSHDLTKKVRPSKTPVNKRGRKTDEDKNNATKTKTVKGSAVQRDKTKKFTEKSKPDDKKGKKDKKKTEKKAEDVKEEKIEEKQEEKQEEKKEVILKDKTIIPIPDELKDNNTLFNLYLIIKGKYLTNKEKYKLLLHPTMYKVFGNNISFLLDDKKQEIKKQINELETFLNNYGDLENYLSKEFTPSSSAKNSLAFVKRNEIENLVKKGDIQPEINNIFKLLFYIFDIPFDENLENENLINYFITDVMDKNGVKDLRSIYNNYIAEHKDLNITQEKYDKINAIVSADEKVLSSIEIGKICRNISYCTLLIRECNEFMNSKTLDDVPYFQLKMKNKRLQELKHKLATLENKEIPPQNEEQPKEENENKKEENENTVTLVIEESVPKENEE